MPRLTAPRALTPMVPIAVVIGAGEGLFLPGSFSIIPSLLSATVAVAAAMASLGVMNGFGNVLTITAFQRWAPPSALGRLAGLLTLTSFGVFPISVALAALVVRQWGPTPFFLLAAVTGAAAILAGLSQRALRDFCASRPPKPEPAIHLEGQTA